MLPFHPVQHPQGSLAVFEMGVVSVLIFSLYGFASVLAFNSAWWFTISKKPEFSVA